MVLFISEYFIFQNIKLSSMRTKAAEDLADEGDAAGAAIVQARNKFLTQVIYHLSNVTQMIWERNAISSVSSSLFGLFFPDNTGTTLRDLLKTNEDVASQSRRILQTFVSIVGGPASYPDVSLSR